VDTHCAGASQSCWPACAPGTEVVFVTLTDGGHVWPDANAEVMRFFLQHARP
jgi:poly(3-hydroxybutyrate) depolymerase